eukprot:scaffold89529_cov56-Attheya_sp.AAC.5
MAGLEVAVEAASGGPSNNVTDEASIEVPLGAVVSEDAAVDERDRIEPPVILGALEEDSGGRVVPPPPPKLLEDAIVFFVFASSFNKIISFQKTTEIMPIGKRDPKDP